MTLKKQAVSGIKWQVAVSMLQRVVSFATTIVLARKLGPSVYGLFAFAIVIVGSFELFKSMGVDAALVRRKDDFERAANTAFIIIPILGLSLYLLLNISSSFLGKYLNNMEVIPIIRVLGITFVIGCFTKVPVISLERNMQFKKISIAEIVSTVVFSISAIVLVHLNYGIWTLVDSYIARTIVYVSLVWYLSKWKPSFSYDKKIAKELFKFGKFVFLTSTLWFLKMNLDNILVGKMLGATMLAFYAVAFNISNFGADYFGGRVYRVMYPAYSKLQNDKDGLQKAFLKVLKYISLVAVPLALGTFFFGSDFIRLAYGEKWMEAVPVMKILSSIALFNLIPVATDSAFMAIGKPNLSFWSALIQVFMFFAFVPPAAKMIGLIGVGIVVSLAAFIAMLMQIVLVMKCLTITVKQVMNSIYPSIMASIVMVSVVRIFRYSSTLVVLEKNMKYIFIPEFVLAGLIYFSVLYVTNRLIVREMREMVRP